MSTAAGEMVANVVAAIAHWESRRIGERTSDAMRAAQVRGVRLGAPRTVSAETREWIADRRRDSWT